MTMTLDNCVSQSEQFIASIQACPQDVDGRGIVIGAGGIRYNLGAWVTINRLRDVGCQLPIEVWYLGAAERDQQWIDLVAPLGVHCVDAYAVRERHPHRDLRGWALKPYAMLHSRFAEVLYLDADNVPVFDPTSLFDDASYRATGAVFWPDLRRARPNSLAWRAFGVPYRDEPEQESGQILVDKRRGWRPLSLANWHNEHQDFFYRFVYGDKDTFRLAWHRLHCPFAMPSADVSWIPRTLCQHDMLGQRIFQHRCMAKWSLRDNPRCAGFEGEEECLRYIDQLRNCWSPLGYLGRGMTSDDATAQQRMVGHRFLATQQGTSRWEVRLGESGQVVDGHTQRTFFWWIERDRLNLADTGGRLTFQLHETAGGRWEGPAKDNARRLLRLEPLSN